eukprot:41543_1
MGNSNSRQNNPSEFICRFNQKYGNHVQIDSFDPRRAVFVSLIELFKTWKLCPGFVLHTAICILPLRKQWIYKPSTFYEDNKNKIQIQFDLFAQDKVSVDEFILFLQYKDSQSLVFWMLDDYDNKNMTTLIHPFWYYFSKKLTQLYDPVTQNHYKSLQILFDIKWWKQMQRRQNMLIYGSKTDDIWSELQLLTMKYRNIQEILHQSNPFSFRIITRYSTSSVSDEKYAWNRMVLVFGFCNESKVNVIFDIKNMIIMFFGVNRFNTEQDCDDGVFNFSNDYYETE